MLTKAKSNSCWGHSKCGPAVTGPPGFGGVPCRQKWRWVKDASHGESGSRGWWCWTVKRPDGKRVGLWVGKPMFPFQLWCLAVGMPFNFSEPKEVKPPSKLKFFISTSWYLVKRVNEYKASSQMPGSWWVFAIISSIVQSQPSWFYPTNLRLFLRSNKVSENHVIESKGLCKC